MASALAVLERDRTIAPPGYNRWLIPPAALAIHLCIGQAYATSVYKNSLVEHFDTSLTAVGIVAVIAIVLLGLPVLAWRSIAPGYVGIVFDKASHNVTAGALEPGWAFINPFTQAIQQ